MYYVRAIDTTNNEILFNHKLDKHCQYKCPRSYLHHFVTIAEEIRFQFHDKDQASNFRSLVENKIIACKLKSRLCASEPETICAVIETDHISSSKNVIRKNYKTLHHKNETNPELMKLTSINIPLVQMDITPNTDIKMTNNRSKNMSIPSEMRSADSQEKENKWLKLKKRITLSVKNHDSREIGSDLTIGNSTIKNTTTSRPAIHKKKDNSINDLGTILDDNSSGEDDSEYHNVSKFFRSEECISSIEAESSEEELVSNKTNDSANIEACEIPATQTHCKETVKPFQRESSPISAGKSGHDWTNTLLQLQKSIDSISGPRLKQSDEDCLQIIPEVDTVISEK